MSKASEADKKTFTKDAANGIYFDYVIIVNNFKYVFDNEGAQLILQAHANPSDATNKNLVFSEDSNTGYDGLINMDEKGILTFNTKLEGITDFSITISSTDNSGVKSFIKIRANKYTTV